MSHLTLEDMTAYVNGVPANAATQDHIAACVTCQTEARRWGAVAGGIRFLGTAAHPPPDILDAVRARAERPPVRRGARRLALASAAALVLLLGSGYALSAAAGPDEGTEGGEGGDSRAVSAVLADTECAGLRVAAGVLESVDGGTLVLRTAGGGTVTVTTAESTEITRQVEGDLDDITNGSHVFVRGTGASSDSGLTAENVTVVPDSVRRAPHLPPNLGRLANRANGTVADAGDGGFTVVTGEGARIRVTTSASTAVITHVDAAPGELEVGRHTVAVGSPSGTNELAATTVQQNSLAAPDRPHPPKMPEGLRDRLPIDPPRALPHDLFKGLGCDSRAIATTALAATS